MSVPDFGKAASDYAKHRQGFPQRLFDWIGPVEGAVLDLGTGTGLMARELARRGGLVTALDTSGDMIASATAAAHEAGLNISHIQARAEETGLTGPFDMISAGTCWHWLDRTKAAAEALRLLRPGGQLVIAHLDWLRRPGNVIDLTLETIHRWNPPPADRKWTFQYPDWLFDLTDAGFSDYEVTAFPASLSYTHDAWVGRIVASAQIGPALPPDRVAAFREEFRAHLTDRFPVEPMAVDHRVFAIRLTRP